MLDIIFKLFDLLDWALQQLSFTFFHQCTTTIAQVENGLKDVVDWFDCDDEKAKALWSRQESPSESSNISIYNFVRNEVSMFWLGSTVSEGGWKMPENGSPLAGIISSICLFSLPDPLKGDLVIYNCYFKLQCGIDAISRLRLTKWMPQQISEACHLPCSKFHFEEDSIKVYNSTSTAHV